MKKVIIAVSSLLILAAPTAVHAQSGSGGGFDYTTNVNNTNTITITGYTAAGGAVAVPPAINGLTVTSIGYEAFDGATNITSVTIPATVTSIGDYAFANCTDLAAIAVPSSVTAIGDAAFKNCVALASFTIPNGVTSIGYETFDSCTAMTNLTIPDTVTSIGDYAFENCDDLLNVTIPISVTSIGYNAFEDSGMTNLTIGVGATIPNGGCAIEEYAFQGCSQLKNLTIGTNVVSIGYNAFDSCVELTNVTIGSGVIQEYAFEGCDQLVNVTLGDGVDSIGYEAFENCTMQTLSIGTNVTSIGYEAFEGCNRLTNATVASGAIGESAFADCEVLQSLTLGDGVTSIGYEAFIDCYDLTNLTIGKNVTSIGYEAFEDCESLKTLTIPGNVSSIGYEAFEGCPLLATVTFGKSVSTIGYQAFDQCYDLTGLYFLGDAPNADSQAFMSDANSNLTVYYYAGAAGWSTTFDGIPTVELFPNSLQVTLGPNAARAAGAQWQLDGGVSQNGVVTTLDEVAPGSHTLTFAPVPGWISPSNQIVIITNGEAASIVALYTPTNTPTNGLILLTNGYGAIQHSGSFNSLTIGKEYTVKAVPQLKNVFFSWTGGTNQPYTVLSTTASYTFAMELDLVLTANFITNPFIPAVGTYNGFFSTTNGVTEATAGMLKNLVIRQNGTYSGSILINGQSRGVSGSFDAKGQAASTISLPASQGGLLLVQMTLDWNDTPPLVMGTVSAVSLSGTNRVPSWTANLTAYLADNNLPSAEYTMLVPPDTNNTPPTGSPGGDGYLLITNHAGMARITGAMADGSSLSQTVPVSDSSYLPIYASLYGGKGLLMGWINLDTTNNAGNTLTWIHPVTAKGSYQGGFTNVLSGGQILLSPWANPPGDFGFLTDLQLRDTISDTNALVDVPVMVSLSGKLSPVNGSINLATGFLKVTIGSGASQVNGYGAILLNATNSGGYYLTGTNAGAVILQP